MPGARASEQERRSQILQAAVSIAARDGVDGLSARRLAEESGLSHGLVFFHFGSMNALRVELLDHLLAGALDAEVTAAIALLPSPAEQVAALLDAEIDGLAEQRAAVELFFEYWSCGRRHDDVRKRIQTAIAAYRGVFAPVVARMVEADPQRWAGVAADQLTTVLVSLVEGYAVQVVLEPDLLDVNGVRQAIRALLGVRPS